MTDYSNSDKSKKEAEPAKVIVPVVLTGEVTDKPKGIGSKFKNIFLGGDAKQAATYVAADVLLPALRDMIVDMTRSGIEKLVYGESRSGRRRPIEARSRIQYSAFSHMRDPRETSRVHLPDQAPRTRRLERAEANDLLLTEKADAETVVERLIDIIDTYEVASVADLNELLGRPSSHVDNKWGWTSLGKVEIRQVREGYLVDLPPVEEI